MAAPPKPQICSNSGGLSLILLTLRAMKRTTFNVHDYKRSILRSLPGYGVPGMLSDFDKEIIACLSRGISRYHKKIREPLKPIPVTPTQAALLTSMIAPRDLAYGG